MYKETRNKPGNCWLCDINGRILNCGVCGDEARSEKRKIIKNLELLDGQICPTCGLHGGKHNQETMKKCLDGKTLIGTCGDCNIGKKPLFVMGVVV